MRNLELRSGEILDGIYVVKGLPRAVGMAFCRPQEHYENKWFRGRVFSLDEFKGGYREQAVKNGRARRFDYVTFFGGWNLPNYALEPFFGGLFGKLSEEEKRLLDLFEKERSRKVAIAGVPDTEPHGTLTHEIAHVFFI